jgi:hypothetical protein
VTGGNLRHHIHLHRKEPGMVSFTPEYKNFNMSALYFVNTSVSFIFRNWPVK